MDGQKNIKFSYQFISVSCLFAPLAGKDCLHIQYIKVK